MRFVDSNVLIYALLKPKKSEQQYCENKKRINRNS